MEMPKEFYELTKKGHATNDRNEKVEVIRNLERMLDAENDMGPYKVNTLLREINDLKNEANDLIIGSVLDKRIFNPRFIRSVKSISSLECKLIEEIAETNPTFSLVKYMLENVGKDIYPELDKTNVWRLEKKPGKVEIKKGDN